MKSVAALAALVTLTGCGPAHAPCEDPRFPVGRAQLCADRASVDFGDYAVPTGKTVFSSLELRNGGGGNLHLETVTLELPATLSAMASWDSGQGAIGPLTLAAGESAHLTFAFTPTEAGSVNGQVVIRSDAENLSSLTVGVWGCGTDAAMPSNSCLSP